MKVPQFHYMKYRPLLTAVSVVLVAASVYIWQTSGDAKWGIDFRGGVELIVRFKQPVDIGVVRQKVEGAKLPGAVVQNFGSDSSEFAIKGAVSESKTELEDVKKALSEIPENSYEVLKQDFVGPAIGDQIRRDGVLATLLGFVAIMIYVTVRFDWAYALGGIVALFHDPIIAVGATILAGHELSGSTLAAVLTIVGFSINDTIVVYDRVRENITRAVKTGSAGKREALSKMTLSDIMDLSINQTLSRTIITNLTVLFVCFTLWVLGGGPVSELAFTLFVGVIVGTYSTIFVACSVVLALSRSASTA